jgi:CheY-like chemotaxis protein
MGGSLKSGHPAVLCTERLEVEDANICVLSRCHGRAATAGGDVFDLLYVEDNPVNVLLLESIVSSRGDIAMRVAADGRTARILVEERRPDLIVLDLRLPDTDGITLRGQLKSLPNAETSPVVLFTAGQSPEKEGFVDVWTKPVDAQQVMASIARLLPPTGLKR